MTSPSRNETEDVTRCVTVSGYGPSNEAGVFQNSPRKNYIRQISWTERAWWTEIVISFVSDKDILEAVKTLCWRLCVSEEPPMLVREADRP